MQLDKGSLIHLIGIGGIGMSAIAGLLNGFGFKVQGSDFKENKITQKLRELGVKVHIGHSSDNLIGVDIVVRSSAIAASNIELESAKHKGIKIYDRSEFLDLLLRKKYVIAATGSHGKTSSTSLIYDLIYDRNFSLICGGILNSIDSNFYVGSENNYVVESDESDGSFLAITPMVSLITSLDFEHVDYYGDFEKLKASYVEYINAILDKNGIIFACDDCEKLRELNVLYNKNKNYITYSVDSRIADIVASGIKKEKFGIKFDLNFSEKMSKITDIRFMRDIRINRFGVHNLLNSIGSIAIALHEKISPDDIKKRLYLHQGVKRRFSILGNKKGINFIDDYAHHPTEIRAVLDSISDFCSKVSNIMVVFEPHKYSRLKSLYKDFCESFSKVDSVAVIDIYGAGENNPSNISSKSLVDDIKKFSNTHCMYCPTIDSIICFINENRKKEDTIVFMGAGVISDIAKKVFNEI